MRLRKHWPAILVFCAWLIFFYRQIFLGEVFFFGDNLSFVLPQAEFWANEIKEGRFPLWNPYIFTGIPFWGDIASESANVFNIFFLFLNPFRALTIKIILLFLCSLFSMYFFLKSLKRNSFEALLGSLVFTFSATLLTYLNNTSILTTACLLPFVFWAGQRVLVRGRLEDKLVLSLAISWQIVSGHPQPTYYTLVLLTFWFIFYPGLSFGEKIKRGFLPAFLGFLMTAFQTLPFLRLASLSTRPGNNFEFATARSLPSGLLARFFLPHLFGSARAGFSWGPAYRFVADNTGYFGLLVILILVLARFRSKKVYQVKFFSGIFFISLLLALGRNTPFYSVFWRLLPGFRFFRNPGQILLLTDFAAAVLLAFFWQPFLIRIRSKKGRQFFSSLLLLSGLGGLFFLVAQIGRESLFNVSYSLLGQIYFFFKKKPLSESAFHQYRIDLIIFENFLKQFFLAIFLIFVFAGLIFLYQKKRISRKMLSGLVIFLIFLDLFIFNRNNFFSVSPQKLSFNQKPADFLKKQPGYWRFISSAGYWSFTGLNVYWENVSLRPPFAESVFTPDEQASFKVLKNRLAVLPPNWGAGYRLSTPMGYGDLLAAGYAAYMSQKTGRININEVDSLPLDDPKLNFLGVKYLLIDADFPATIREINSYPHFFLAKDWGSVRIYENKEAFPRAFWEGESGEIEPAEIILYQPNKVVLKSQTKKPGRIVLTDAYYPGWQVRVDESERPIEKYREVFRSVAVSGDEEVIEFVYRPELFYWGSGMSLGGILIVSFLFLKRLFLKVNK